MVKDMFDINQQQREEMQAKIDRLRRDKAEMADKTHKCCHIP